MSAMKIDASLIGIALVFTIPVMMFLAPEGAPPPSIVTAKTDIDDDDSGLAVWHLKAERPAALWARVVQRHNDLYILAVGWEYGNSDLILWYRGTDGYWHESDKAYEPLEGPQAAALAKYRIRIDWPDDLEPPVKASLSAEERARQAEVDRKALVERDVFTVDGKWLIHKEFDLDAHWKAQREKIGH